MAAPARETADRLTHLFTVRRPGPVAVTWAVFDGRAGQDGDA
jgi:hypothetical protein